MKPIVVDILLFSKRFLEWTATNADQPKGSRLCSLLLIGAIARNQSQRRKIACDRDGRRPANALARARHDRD
jgi:hypothetical protein